jgi:putative ABC transport system permease protein
MSELFENVHYSLRRLKNAPSFTILVLATMALGIGANSAVFSVINDVLLRPLPYRDPQSLVLITEKARDFPKLSVSYQNYRDWKDQSRSFAQFAAVRNTSRTLTGAGEPERLPAQMASANLFDTLGTSVKIGRDFLSSDDKEGAGGVVLIGNNLWQRRFSGSPAVLGQSINLDNKPYLIVGVLAAAFQILQQSPDVIVPLEPWARTLPDDHAWHPGIGQ